MGAAPQARPIRATDGPSVTTPGRQCRGAVVGAEARARRHQKSGARIRKHEEASLVWFGLVWFGLVWFGLVGFSFNASLEPQPRARRRALVFSARPWFSVPHRSQYGLFRSFQGREGTRENHSKDLCVNRCGGGPRSLPTKCYSKVKTLICQTRHRPSWTNIPFQETVIA